MKQAFDSWKNLSWQTWWLILTLALYGLALLWTTVQSYARLEYSRTQLPSTNEEQPHEAPGIPPS